MQASGNIADQEHECLILFSLHCLILVFPSFSFQLLYLLYKHYTFCMTQSQLKIQKFIEVLLSYFLSLKFKTLGMFPNIFQISHNLLKLLYQFYRLLSPLLLMPEILSILNYISPHLLDISRISFPFS